jgi:hypothetical protein
VKGEKWGGRAKNSARALLTTPFNFVRAGFVPRPKWQPCAETLDERKRGIHRNGSAKPSATPRLKTGADTSNGEVMRQPRRVFRPTYLSLFNFHLSRGSRFYRILNYE